MERDSVTQIYWKPAPEVLPAPVRTFEVADDRFTIPVIPSFAPPTLAARGSQPERTHAMRRVVSPTALRISFAAMCVLVGIIIGSVIVFSGGSGAKASAATAPAPKVIAPKIAAPVVMKVTPAAAPVVMTVTPAAPRTTNVRLESEPAGATATLVDNGKATPVGTTPIDVQLDPSHQYEIVFSMDAYQTQLAHIDPTVDHHVAVALVADAPAAPVATHRHHHAASVAAPVAPIVVAKQTGMLKVSSKPSCSIVIDGKPSGRSTPQLAMALPVGTHQVTLTNAAEGIQLTTEIQIAADHPTQLIQDFTK